MRIEFTKQTDADIRQTPKSAWGRLQLRAEPTVPSFDATKKPEPTAPPKHYFPVGAIVDLPDEIAAGYVETGLAKVSVSPRGAVLFNVERPE